MGRVRRSKANKNAFIMITVAIAITIIVISAIRNQTGSQGSQKPPASQYLKVEHIGSFGEFYNNGRTVFIRELGLRIIALGGDATDIMITGLPTMGEEYPYIAFIREGESKDLTIPLKGYTTSLEKDGYPVNLTIGCNEASPEEIRIFLKFEDITGPS